MKASILIIAGLLAGTSVAQAQSYNSDTSTFGDRVRNGEFAGHNYQQEQQRDHEVYEHKYDNNTDRGYSNPYQRNPD